MTGEPFKKKEGAKSIQQMKMKNCKIREIKKVLPNPFVPIWRFTTYIQCTSINIEFQIHILLPLQMYINF